MLELRQQFRFADLLKLARLARSTFYHQLRALRADDKHADTKARIRAIFHQHRGRYGYRRVTAVIRQQGCTINHKTVQRLMGELQLKSRVRERRWRPCVGQVSHIAPNLLERKFEAERPNEKWVTDVTEFNLKGQKLYLSPVLDLYNGEIVAYEMATRPHFSMIDTMLRKACTRLGAADRLMLHSDQGWQYRMPVYDKALRERAITQSMSRKGNCFDNAAMESFFATLKTEFYYQNRFRNLDELQQGIAQYIHYYNFDRIKLKLGGLSPVTYRIGLAST